MYAFDIHCNSYFPLFILLYGKLVTLISSYLWKPYRPAISGPKKAYTLPPQTLSQQQGHVRLSDVSYWSMCGLC